MTLIALGINHQTAPVSFRERLAISTQRLPEVLKSLIKNDISKEVALLSTCHRTEIYAHGAKADDLKNWLASYHTIALDEMDAHLFMHTEQAAMTHILRVASGLDSMILGEPQVLGQLKHAFRLAKKLGSLGGELDRLIQHAFYVAKTVRSQTAIGAHPISLAYAAVKRADYLFADFKPLTVLLVGRGTMIQRAYQHLYEKGVRQFIVANRQLHTARAWLKDKPGKVIPLLSLPSVLHQADIIVSATASSLPIIGKGAIERAMQHRSHKPLLMIDLAMPRDIEPEVAKCQDVYLYDVDHLAEIIDENMSLRQQAQMQAQFYIEQGVQDYLTWRETRVQMATANQYSNQLKSYQASSLAKARAALANGHPADQVLERFAHDFSQKVLSAPNRFLRNQISDEQSIKLIEQFLGLGE